MKKKRLARGENFLPNVGIENLKALRKRETDAKARDRLLAYIYRKEGKSIREIGKIFGQAYTLPYVTDWFVQIRQDWKDSTTYPPPGLSRRLSPEHIAELRANLIAGPQKHDFESEMWTGRMMGEHIRRKYGIEYVPPHNAAADAPCGVLIRQAKAQTPRISLKQGKKRLKKDRRITTYYSNRGYKILAGDESSHIIGWNIQNG